MNDARTEQDWVKQAAKHNRAEIAHAIFDSFGRAGDERGVCDGPVLAATLREVINQLQEGSGIIYCSKLLYTAEALEEFDFQAPNC